LTILAQFWRDRITRLSGIWFIRKSFWIASAEPWRGLNNKNIKKLNQLFRPESIDILSDPDMAKNNLMLNGRNISLTGADND
jgi:hypothetical protein